MAKRRRRVYNEKDKALVYAELTATDGNVRRTAINLGIPATTVKRWKDEWAQGGLPEKVEQALIPTISDFLEDAKRIRNKLLGRLEQMLEDDRLNARDVNTAIGILSDKIRSYEAISESRRVEHTFKLPPAEEVRELFTGMVTGVVEAAQQRALEIEDVVDLDPADFREIEPASKEA